MSRHGLERFAGRTLGVATIHGKEHVIGPALMKALPIAGFEAIKGGDTDGFGTFSEDVQRRSEPLEACKAKAKHGAGVSGLDLIIASEGSFFPNPPAPFVPVMKRSWSSTRYVMEASSSIGTYHRGRCSVVRTAVIGGK